MTTLKSFSDLADVDLGDLAEQERKRLGIRLLRGATPRQEIPQEQRRILASVRPSSSDLADVDPEPPRAA